MHNFDEVFISIVPSCVTMAMQYSYTVHVARQSDRPHVKYHYKMNQVLSVVAPSPQRMPFMMRPPFPMMPMRGPVPPDPTALQGMPPQPQGIPPQPPVLPPPPQGLPPQPQGIPPQPQGLSAGMIQPPAQVSPYTVVVHVCGCAIRLLSLILGLIPGP